MEEISLYRKYRPHNFDNLVGQDNIKTTLINAIKAGHTSHAYLFTGPRGTGKTSTARLIAKALNCTNLTDGYEPCNECDFCNDINEGRLIDLIEIDAASNRGIDEVRDLKEKINFAPTRAKYKIYIVDEVHMMTKEAFNALLKTLEEPPAHAYFILATTEVHKIPATIISRCQRFDFKRITPKALMTRLSYIAQKEGIEAEDKALEIISKYVDGGLRDAIGLLEQLTANKKLESQKVQEILGVSDLSLLEKLSYELDQGHTKEALQIIQELHSQGSDLRQFTHEFIDMLRNQMLRSIAEDKIDLTEKFIILISIFQDAQQKLEYSIPQLALEIAVVQATNILTGTYKDEKPPDVGKKTTKNINKVEAEKVLPEEIPELGLKALADFWPRVMERVKTPTLRMSLKNANPAAVKNLDVTLEFGSNFHKDKVMEHDSRVELESVIKQIFGKPVKISATVKALEIKPVIEEKHNTLDEALEIFGGEVVD